MPKLCLLCLSVALFPAVSSARPGAPRPRVFALRELRVDGDMTEAERKLLKERTLTAVEMIVIQAGAQFIEMDEVERVLGKRKNLRDCYEWRCGAQLGDLLKANRLLTVRIERSGPEQQPGNWVVRLSSFATDALTVVGTQVVPCESCVAEDLVTKNIITRALERVIKNEPPTPLCQLKVESEPSDARLFLDSEEFGRTPFDRAVEARVHRVAVEEKGFARGQAVIQCPPDGKQAIQVTLTPQQASVITKEGPPDGGPAVIAPPTPPDRRRLYRWLGGTSAALAVAGLAIVIVEGARFHTCDDSQCRFRRDTSVGLAFSTVATAGFAVGAGFLLREGFRARPTKPRVSLWLSPSATAQGVGVGLGGNF